MKVKKENHDGNEVWINKKTDKLRKAECLCLNCLRMDSCVVARNLYDICREMTLAIMTTRCPRWIENKELKRNKKII